MFTGLTHVKTIFEYCHASVNSDNVGLLYLEDVNVHKPVLENKTQLFFSIKPFLVRYCTFLV